MAGSEEMRELGIRQCGDPVLKGVCRQFDLPGDAALAREVERRLTEMIERLARAHDFAKGMGLAAPQIGIPRAAAMIRPAGGGQAILLLNPVVVERSDETDVQFEGCLSFFDVRGRVPRAVGITVAHVGLDDAPLVTSFENGPARLVLHEIDHLEGVLYPQRMLSEARLVPISEYRQAGRTWEY